MTPLTIIVALLLLVSAPALAADPDALWKIVHDGCVPAEEAHGEPRFPCLLVDLSAGIDNAGSALPSTR
jgi:CDP-diacylglycerol pyrophosphatase